MENIAYVQSIVLDKLGFCGCGSPEDVLKLLKEVLEILDMRNPRDKDSWQISYKKLEERFYKDDTLLTFFLYWLDDKELTEHGGSVGGSWLSSEGKILLEKLRNIPENDYELVFMD